METREEYYLAKLSGQSDSKLPDPITRQDYYLAKLCGVYTGTLPDPITPQEVYLKYICENGSIGGSSINKFKKVSLDITFTGPLTFTSV